MQQIKNRESFPLILTVGGIFLINLYYHLMEPYRGSDWLSVINIYFAPFIQVICLFLLLKFLKLSIPSIIGLEKVKRKPLLECLIVMLLLVLFSFVTYFSLYPFLTGTLYSIRLAGRISFQVRTYPMINSWIRSLIRYIVIAPIVEELIYRGFLLNALSDKLGKVFSLFISSIVFSLIHMPQGRDFINLFVLFLGGLLWGLIYLRTKQLIYPIIGHALFNLLIIYIQPLIMRGINVSSLFDMRHMMLGIEIESLERESFIYFHIIFWICVISIMVYIIWNIVSIWEKQLPYQYNLEKINQKEEREG